MNILRATNLESSNIVHGFFGRRGGASQSIFASLNCGPGSGDARADVIENRRRVAEALGAGAQLITLYQIHSPNVATVAAPWNIGEGPQADAMVTNAPDVALGILTADCAPVLFADADAGVIGAAHAGWKGALGGITDSTLQAMEALGARRQRIVTAIGPCISQTNYEVGPEFRDKFAEIDSRNARFFSPSDRVHHFRFDLEGYIRERLQAAQIGSIECLSTCTYASEADFFSFRRATHRDEKDYGRQVSAIVLKA
jgi:YfiH family protein